MKTFFVTVSLITLVGFSLKAQENFVSTPPHVNTLMQSQPLFLVNGIKTGPDYLFVNESSIDAVNVIKDSLHTAEYGEAGKNGVVKITTKKDVKLLGLQQILNRYNLLQYHHKLRVSINKVLVSTPDLILIEDKELLAVDITDEIKWVDIKDAGTNEKFINITVPAYTNILK